MQRVKWLILITYSSRVEVQLSGLTQKILAEGKLEE